MVGAVSFRFGIAIEKGFGEIQILAYGISYNDRGIFLNVIRRRPSKIKGPRWETKLPPEWAASVYALV
jgi:hypothetical protein